MMRSEGLTPDEADQLLSRECGLAGSVRHQLRYARALSRRGFDRNAAEAVDLFWYSIKKYIGAYAAVLGGLDALVFSGGIGEHSPESRAGICQGLEFLGISIDGGLNSTGSAVISPPRSRVTVRIIPTDEELMVANIVYRSDSHRHMATSNELTARQHGNFKRTPGEDRRLLAGGKLSCRSGRFIFMIIRC